MSRTNPTTIETEAAQPQVHNIVPQCPVCGSTQWRPFRKGTDIRRPKEQSLFRIDRCTSCGHLMQSPLPSPQELSAAYAVEYAPYRPAWKKGRPSLWRLLRYITTARHTHRLQRFARGNKVLDVGCGAGDFLYAMHRAGWQVAGVEYNQTLARMLRSELGFDVHPGEMKPGLWPSESFDAVTIWSVIEHVLDPVAVMNLAASYLRAGGVMILQFPTSHGLARGTAFSQYWEILDLPRHINYFNKGSLSALCDRAGLDLTIYKTPAIDSAWCWYTSSMNFANAATSKVSKYIRLMLLAPITILALPYLALLSWSGHGTEAWAVVIKR